MAKPISKLKSRLIRSTELRKTVPQVQHLNPMNRRKTVHYFTSVPDAAVRIEFSQIQILQNPKRLFHPLWTQTETRSRRSQAQIRR